MADAVIDLDAIQADIGKMSEEDLRKTLLDMKVKEKVATGKYYNPETAKKARLKAAATKKAIVELAKKNGWFDAIDAEAKKTADAEIAKAKLAKAAAKAAEAGGEEDEDEGESDEAEATA